MKSVAVVAATALTLSSSAAMAQQTTAQSGQPTSKPDATQTGAAQNASSQAFVREAATAGLAELQLGQLAAQKASSADVKQFAQRMVTDHSKANDELKAVAQKKNIIVPATLTGEHKEMHDRLSKLSGAAFDRAYMDAMRDDHRKAVAMFRAQSQSGDDAEVKAFAAKTLPTVQEHLKLAEQTHAAVGTSGTTTDRNDRTGTTGTRPADPVSPGAPGTPGSPLPTPGSTTPTDPRNQPGSVPGTGIQR
jgi:putative membrane protein